MCATLLGDDPGTLVADLKARFPKGALEPSWGRTFGSGSCAATAIEAVSSDGALAGCRWGVDRTRGPA